MLHRIIINYLFVILATFAVVVSSAIGGVTDSSRAAAKYAVNQYIELLSEAEMWTEDGLERINNITKLEHEFTSIHGESVEYIISGFGIDSVEVKNNVAIATICFEVLGTLKDRDEFIEDIKNKVVKIYIDKIDSDWLIRTQIFPHIKLERAIRNYKDGNENIRNIRLAGDKYKEKGYRNCAKNN